jgi:hypothetical protein
MGMCVYRVYQLTVKKVRDLAYRISDVIGNQTGSHPLRICLFMQFPDHIEILRADLVLGSLLPILLVSEQEILWRIPSRSCRSARFKVCV